MSESIRLPHYLEALEWAAMGLVPIQHAGIVSSMQVADQLINI